MVADGKMISVVKPSRVKHGYSLDVGITTKNAGDVLGTFSLQMSFDGTPIVKTPPFNLNPGSTKQQTLSHNAPAIGTSVDVELDLFKVIDITDFDALKPYLVNGYIGEHWWDFTEAERRRIAETAIKNTLFNGFWWGRSGASDCGGSTGDKYRIVCAQNAVIRLLKFGTGVPGDDDCYYYDKSGNEHCYVPAERFNLPCYQVRVLAGERSWGHAMCAIKVNKNIDDLNSWVFFQYATFDIKPGDWQIPTDTYDWVKIQLLITTKITCCGCMWGDIFKIFTL